VKPRVDLRMVDIIMPPGHGPSSSGWGCSGQDSLLGKRSREEDGKPGVAITGDEQSLSPHLAVASLATTDPFPPDSTTAHLLGPASLGAAAAVQCDDGRQCHSPGCTAVAWSQASAVAAFTSHAASDVAATPATPCGGQGPGSDGHGTAPGEARPMLPPQSTPLPHAPLPQQQQLTFVNGVPCAHRALEPLPHPPSPALPPAPSSLMAALTAPLLLVHCATRTRTCVPPRRTS
jgi:hypothetical protein